MTPSPSFYVLTVSALYMALRAPQDRLADAIDLADGFACHLDRDAVERAKTARAGDVRGRRRRRRAPDRGYS
jgi:hypothetical protein